MIDTQNGALVENTHCRSLRVDSPSESRLDNVEDQRVETVTRFNNTSAMPFDSVDTQVVEVREEQWDEDRGRGPKEAGRPEVGGEKLEEI